MVTTLLPIFLPKWGGLFGICLLYTSQMKSEELAAQWCRDHPDATLEQAFMAGSVSYTHLMLLLYGVITKKMR